MAGLFQAPRVFRGKTEARPWRPRDIKRILVNPIYAGIMSYGGETHQGDFEPYITTDQHEWLKLRYGSVKPRSEGPRVKGRVPKTHLLAGLASCGKCGARIYSTTRTRPRKDGSHLREYTCAGYGDGGGMCRVHVDAEKVDQAVLAEIDKLLANLDDWRQQILSNTATEREGLERKVDNLVAQLEKTNVRIARAQRDYEEALDTDPTRAEMAVKAMANARARQDTVQAEIREHRAAMAELDERAVTEHLDGIAGRLRERDVALLNDALRAEFRAFIIRPIEGKLGGPQEAFLIEPQINLDTSFQRYLRDRKVPNGHP